MAQRMIGIRVSITQCIDDSQWPAYVECEFEDAYGNVHRFTEKSAVVTCDDINSGTRLPYPAVVACEIVEQCRIVGDTPVYLVDTENPWHVSSTEDKTRFEVPLRKLVEWEFGSPDHRPWNGVA